MWKLVPKMTKGLLAKPIALSSSCARLFLSESYKLESVWNDRLTSPILSKINVNDMFFELENQFQHSAVASALDIDLFVNAVNDDSTFDEVEDVVHKLRLSPEAINILPSTHHALIRLFMKSNKSDDLMRILDDRLNYGIFSDDYCSLLMMDSFIKEGNFRDAAKVSTFNMLQEDVSNPLINYMSLYCCHKYLENPVPWIQVNSEETEPEDDEEEIKVRVKYIRNPYFDDHFDLVEPNHLIGKTLSFIGSEINDHIGYSYKLLGLLLHDKHFQAKDYIQSLSSKKEHPVLVRDGLNIAKKIMEDKIKIEGKDEQYIAIVNELSDLINTAFTDSQLSEEGTLLSLVEVHLKDLINKHEVSEINKQLQLYKDWEKNREKLLMEQIAKINREKQLAEVERQKQILQQQEEQLFFFDNENKLDLILEEKEKRKQERLERERIAMELKYRSQSVVKTEERKREHIEPPLNEFIDENIPMKLVKTKL